MYTVLVYIYFDPIYYVCTGGHSTVSLCQSMVVNSVSTCLLPLCIVNLGNAKSIINGLKYSNRTHKFSGVVQLYMFQLGV